MCDNEACKRPDNATPPQTAAPVSPQAAASVPDDYAGRRGTSPGARPAKASSPNAARMPEHRAQCFSTAKRRDAAQLKEFAAQRGMSWYAEKRQEGAKAPRQGEGAKQKDMRQQYERTIKASIVKSLQCRAMSQQDAEKRADAKLPAILNGLQALHEPDIAVAGSDVTRLGDGSVNASIGMQWAQSPGGRYGDDSRRYRLLADVMVVQSSVGNDALLNVVLEPCRQ